MKYALIAAIAFVAVSAKAQESLSRNLTVNYNNLPSVVFNKYTYDQSESVKNAALQECVSKMSEEKARLKSLGLTIVSETSCQRHDLKPGETGEADSVHGEIYFIK